MLKSLRTLLLLCIFSNNLNNLEANITALSIGIGVVSAASYEIYSEPKTGKKETVDKKTEKKSRFSHLTNKETIKKIVKKGVLGGLTGGFFGYIISKKTPTKSLNKQTISPTPPKHPHSHPPVFHQQNKNNSSPPIIQKTNPQAEKKTPKDIQLNTVTLDEWWGSENATKGGFVLPFFYENGEKYYIFGNEWIQTGWCPFGGKCDNGETALEGATREFWEESGVQRNTLEQLMIDVDRKSRAENGGIFTICTNSDQEDKNPNLIIFYFAEWSKKEIFNAFGNHDNEMDAFGFIKESSLKDVLKNMSVIKNTNSEDFKEEYKCFFKSQKEIVETMVGNQHEDGLRDLIYYLSFYFVDTSKTKKLKTGEYCFDLRYAQ